MIQGTGFLSKLIVALLCLDGVICAVVEATNHPVVGDWREAEWFNGLIRIPLKNPDGHAWILSLTMGTPVRDEQICVIDNNNAVSSVFSK